MICANTVQREPRSAQTINETTRKDANKSVPASGDHQALKVLVLAVLLGAEAKRAEHQHRQNLAALAERLRRKRDRFERLVLAPSRHKV